MSENITVKINVTRLLKEHFFKGKNGTYCDLILIPKKDGTDQYGNHYSVAQSVSNEARQRGEKGPFVGDAKILGTIRVERKPDVSDVSPFADDQDSVPF